MIGATVAVETIGFGVSLIGVAVASVGRVTGALTGGVTVVVAYGDGGTVVAVAVGVLVVVGGVAGDDTEVPAVCGTDILKNLYDLESVSVRFSGAGDAGIVGMNEGSEFADIGLRR